MTLKECLAAMRAEKLVALPEPALPASGAVEGGEERNRSAKAAVSSGPANIYPVNTGDSVSDSKIYPRKPDDSCGESEIYPRSTRISPSTRIELVQCDILFEAAQQDPEKSNSDTERAAPLGEKRGDREVLGVHDVGSHGEIGEEKPKTKALPVAPVAERRREPHLTPGGTLVIPFDCDPKYHWWKPGGQAVKQTMAEVRAALGVERGQIPAPPSVSSKTSPEAPVG